MSKEDYNDEPVLFCSACLSLAIQKLDEVIIRNGDDVRIIKDQLFCRVCGTSDIATANIKEWERKYESFYGKKFVDTNNK